MTRLTIVIRTHDREGLLGLLLDTLAVARLPAGGAEVLVIANNCRDGTHALLAARAETFPLPLRWIAEPKAGKSHALNRALPEVATPLVAFVDDDQRVDEGWIEALFAAADGHPEADLFCGRLIPDWDGSEPPWVHDRGPYRIYPLPTPDFAPGDEERWLDPSGPLPGGGNIVAHLPWLARVGPFATELGPVGHNLGGGEDADWLRRAFAAGARLLYVPTMLQLHHVESERLTVGYLMQKAYKRTAASIGLDGHEAHGVPAYVYRKLAGYMLAALTAVDSDRRRFYLIRSAAAAGELVGHRRLRQTPRVR